LVFDGLGDEGRRIRELTSVVQKRFNFQRMTWSSLQRESATGISVLLPRLSPFASSSLVVLLTCQEVLLFILPFIEHN
jgi:hypothetical protein